MAQSTVSDAPALSLADKLHLVGLHATLGTVAMPPVAAVFGLLAATDLLMEKDPAMARRSLRQFKSYAVEVYCVDFFKEKLTSRRG